MTELKHTPAPWDINAYNLAEVIKINAGPDKNGVHYVDGRHQQRVAMVGTDNDMTWSERYANARLIAQSPKLLACLKAAVDMLEQCAKQTHFTLGACGNMEEFRKTIADAEGVKK